MSVTRTCLRCGCELSDARLEGLCPACLLHAGLFAADEDVSESEEAKLPRIEGYRLIEQIGIGGMGVVYKAEQLEPINRIVAIKLIKLGMDTQELLARFDAERQALAQLNHPNVAAVYQADATQKGRPFFVMEYLPGEPITAFCDRHNYTTRQRLELFTQACDGIQHAHQKAIIHRDIKPSNLLVMLDEGGKPLVKVIDFGVAKATERRLTEQTMFTAHGQLIGTPEYMSPEQADMNPVDVDTRTDIYSLGVVLYELLSGTPPFAAHELRQAAFGEIQRIIREVDAPRPSMRLSTVADAAEVAFRRQTQLGALTRELRQELEWIPLKALRKERADRYATVSDFADDVKNYLDGRALQAGPQSALYRAKKLLSRNRGKAIAVALILISVLLGFGGTYLGMRRARQMAISENALRQLAEHRQRRAELDHYATQFRFAAQAAAQPSLRGADAVQLLRACEPQLRGWEWHYLHRRLTASSRILRPPDASNLVGMSVSADGQRFAAIGGLEPPESTEREGSSQPSTRPSHYGLWAWNGDRLIAMRRLEIAEGIEQQPPEDDATFPTFTCDPDGKFFAYSDLKGALRLCSADSNRVLWTKALGRGCAGKFSDDGRYFVCAAAGGEAFLVQPSTLDVKQIALPPFPRAIPPVAHWGPQTVLALSPEANRLAIGTGDGSVVILDTRTGDVSARIQVDHRPVVGLRFAEHSVLAATGRFTLHPDTGYIMDRPGNIIVLAQPDAQTEKTGAAKAGAGWHIENSFPTDQTILDATLDPHGVLVAVGTGSRLDEWSWYVPHARLEYRSGIPEDLGSNSTAARFDGSGKTAFRALYGAVQMLDRDVARGFRRLTPAVEGKQAVDRVIAPPPSLGNAQEIIATSPEDDRAFVRYSRNAIFEFDLQTGRTDPVIINGVSPAAIRAFSSDGQTVVVASGLRVRFIDRGSGRMLSETSDLPHPCVHASYTPDGKTLWIAADDWSRKGAVANASAILAWDVQQRRWTAQRHFADRGIHSMITSPDGRWIAVLKTHHPQPRELEVLDTELRTVFALAAQSNGVRSVGNFGFRPDSGAIAVVLDIDPRKLRGASMPSAQPDPALDEGGLRLRQFALPGGGVLGSEYGGSSDCDIPDTHVDSITYSPDARRIVTGGQKLRIWDAASGQPLLELADEPGASGQFRSFRFISGDRLLAANDNGSLYVFEAASATLSTTARASDGQ